MGREAGRVPEGQARSPDTDPKAVRAWAHEHGIDISNRTDPRRNPRPVPDRKLRLNPQTAAVVAVPALVLPRPLAIGAPGRLRCRPVEAVVTPGRDVSDDEEWPVYSRCG